MKFVLAECVQVKAFLNYIEMMFAKDSIFFFFKHVLYEFYNLYDYVYRDSFSEYVQIVRSNSTEKINWFVGLCDKFLRFRKCEAI